MIRQFTLVIGPFFAGLIFLLIASGCGGSNALESDRTGRSSFAIRVHWPEQSRFIHSKANRILIEAWINDSERVQRLVIERPTDGGVTSTELSVPSGPVTIWMHAFKLGEENVLSQAKYFNVFLPGVNDPISIDLISKTATIDVARVPQKDIYTVGETYQLVPTAYNAEGSILLVEGQDFTYSSENPGIASVSATGLVTVLAAGSTQLVVSEAGSGPGGQSAILSATGSSISWNARALPLPSDFELVEVLRGNAEGRFFAVVRDGNSRRYVGSWNYPQFEFNLIAEIGEVKLNSYSNEYIAGYKAFGNEWAPFLFNTSTGQEEVLNISSGKYAVVGNGVIFVNRFDPVKGWQPIQVRSSGNVEMNPEQAIVVASDGTQHVGYGPFTGTAQALLWNLVEPDAVQLTPVGFETGIINGVHSAQQVGAVSDAQRYSAILWRSSRHDFTILHPSGVDMSSVALATYLNHQVGYTEYEKYNSVLSKAAYWSNSASTYVDLSQYLIPPTLSWDHSQAVSIWDNGSNVFVFGVCGQGSVLSTPILWYKEL